MPYVEVWVDEPELDRHQVAALSHLVCLARRIARDQWPSQEAQDLEQACNDVIRSGLPIAGPTDATQPGFDFPADRKYREWQQRRAEGATDA
jgi:hypothetical protein